MKDDGTERLATQATPRKLDLLVRNGLLDAPALDRALQILGHRPDTGRWGRFLDLLLLVLGAGFGVSGVFFFFAFNWAAMHHFVKLGIVAGLMVIAAGLSSWRKLDSLPGKIALVVAALLVGALLAVYGQSYQMGADSYQLFVTWTLLTTGWVVISRFAPLWFGWIALLNVGLALYWVQAVGEINSQLFLCLWALNAAAIVAWELAHARGIGWLSSRWFPRVLALLMFGSVVVPTIALISGGLFSHDVLLVAMPALLAGTIMGAGYIYARKIPDPFMLTICASSLIVTLNAWFLHVLEWGSLTLFLMGGLLIGQTAVTVTLLRRLSRSWTRPT